MPDMTTTQYRQESIASIMLKEMGIMVLNNKLYNTLKWLLLTVVPALITLISGLGTVYGFDTTQVTAVIGIIATFIGAVVGISNANYAKGGPDNAGSDQ